MKPNFSGTWQFSRARSQLGIPAPDGTTLSVKHRDPIFELTRTHVTNGNAATLTLDLRTDGSETIRDFPGFSLRVWLQWDGDELVFDAIVRRGEHTGRNTVRYRIADPNVLIADERYRGADTNYDNVWWFDRLITPFVSDSDPSDRRGRDRSDEA